MPSPVRAGARFDISFRPERDEDFAFLAALYASSRGEKFGGLGWPPDMLAAFLEQQWRAQRLHHRAAFPDAEWLIVESGGVPVGRVAIDRRDSGLHLIDIALVPERRGGGVGGAILLDLIAEADALGVAVSLRVDQDNPARRLYERLGFRALEARPPYLLLQRPGGS